MKTLFILVALIGFVFGSPESYNNGESMCELLDVDATFVTMPIGSQDNNTITTGPNSFATGSCSNTASNLKITFNDTGAAWTLFFSVSAQNDVSLNMILQYDAAKMFPGGSLTGNVVLTQVGKATLSPSDKSYKCNAEQTFTFRTNSAVGGTNYTATLTMKNLQVQAFNVADKKFSEAAECPQDAVSTSTSEKTTQESSPSTSPSESTSEETSTSTSTSQSTSEITTSEAPTTTEGPQAPVNTYKVEGDNETCLIMVAAISLSVNYQAKDNTTKTRSLVVPKDPKVQGMCGNGTESNATITISFGNNTVEFLFMDASKKSEIEKVTATVTLDANNFPDAKTPGMKVMMVKDKAAIAQSDDSTFYLCETGDEVTFNNSDTMELKDLQVQAFNLDNGNFTGTGDRCAADMSTSASPSTSTSTSTPTTTPEPKLPVNNFTITDGNVTCLLMKASLVLQITYTQKDGKSNTVNVNVPQIDPSEISGTCGNTSEQLTMKFFNGWEISLLFEDTDGLEDDGSLGATVKNYALNNVSVTYVYDSRLPNANKTGSETVETSKLNMFGAAVDGSYKCTADSTVKVNNDVNMEVSNLQYQAFQTGNSQNFNTGDLTECEADMETNSVVPIAVGAALAGLVVIVLIAYLIGRRKSRRAGYESV